MYVKCFVAFIDSSPGQINSQWVVGSKAFARFTLFSFTLRFVSSHSIHMLYVDFPSSRSRSRIAEENLFRILKFDLCHVVVAHIDFDILVTGES